MTTELSPAMQAKLRKRRAAARHAAVLGTTFTVTALAGLVAAGAAVGWWEMPFVENPELPDPTVAGVSAGASSLTCGPDGTLPVAEPPSFTLDVLNGSGQDGAAGSTGEALAPRGFVIGKVGNTDATPDTLSVIRYVPGTEAQAAVVALHTGIVATAADPNVSTVTLILGSDFTGVLSAEDAAARLAGGEIIPGCRAAPPAV